MILELWTNERNTQQIQRLPPNFCENVNQYLLALKTRIESSENSEVQEVLLKTQQERTLLILKDLFETRKAKIKRTLSNGVTISTESLLPMEKELLEDLEKSLKSYHEKLGWLLEGRLPPKKAFLRMVRPVEAFVGVDLNMYGPFAAEEFATVPIENAVQLIKRGYAVEIETANQ